MKKAPVPKAENKILNFLKQIPFRNLFNALVLKPLKKILHFFNSWKIITSSICVIFFLYYPIGALRINHIDTDINFETIPQNPQASGTIEMMAYIIDREVNENFWTPNLPFFFPSYILDNMPNFQLGMFSSLANFSSSFAKRIDKQTSQDAKTNLFKASKLLQYSGKIWIFSPENRLTPVPSANSQYRKARNILLKYNLALGQSSKIFIKSPDDLAFLLKSINKDLNKVINDLEVQIREESTSLIDTKADDIFFYNQGKIYTNYLLLKSLGYDYKDIIVSNNLYTQWIKALKALEQGSTMNPTIIRNGEIDSTTAPNHLVSLGFYGLKAQNSLQKIITTLDKN